MPSFTHDFYELPLTIDGKEFLASGSVNVRFSIQPAEPDVGIMSSYPEEVYIEDKTIELTLLDEEGNETSRIITKGFPDFSALEDALEDELEQAANEWDGGWDYDE